MGFIPPNVSREREAQAIELRRQGYSQRQIAERLGVTQPAVAQIFQRVDRRLLVKLEAAAKVLKVQQTHVLDYILEEALAAWRQSKDAFKASTKKTKQLKPRLVSRAGAVIHHPDDPADAAIEEILNRAESRYGDPRFLDQARGALADKRKLWGLDIAPAPQAPNANPLDKLSAEELEAIAARLEQQLADAKTARGSK